MKKSDTIIEKSIKNVPGFSAQYKRLRGSVEISGKSQSTLSKYALRRRLP